MGPRRSPAGSLPWPQPVTEPAGQPQDRRGTRLVCRVPCRAPNPVWRYLLRTGAAAPPDRRAAVSIEPIHDDSDEPGLGRRDLIAALILIALAIAGLLIGVGR